MQARYVIIGNSIAGVSCIEGIREVDTQGEITVLSDEGIVNYSRPLISYYIGKQLSRERIGFRDKNFYEEHRVKLFLGRKVEKIDVEKKQVHLNSKEIIRFQKLLIATGGKPVIPPIEGLHASKEGVFTFTRLQDAEKLVENIEKANIKEAVVLGAGLIGLKCTEGLAKRGLSVRIIELADRILANTFDTEASNIVENALHNWSCTVTKEDTITKIKQTRGKIEKVILRSGEEIPTKLLVIAVGVRPNRDLIEGTPIRYDRGILVNNFMQTNIKDIYAAGDVAQGKDFLTQKNSVIAIWPVASHQGKIAGLNMAEKQTEYRGSLIMNSVEMAGIPTISFGITSPPDTEGFEIISKKDTEKRFYRKIVLRDNRIVGAIFLGNIERAGILLGLIKDKIDVAPFKEDLQHDEFGLLVLPAKYRKHLVWGEGIEV